jgi:hypothetical protein
MSLVTGMPVQRATIFAISSSVTVLAQQELLPSVRRAFPARRASCFLQLGQVPYLSFGGLVQVVFARPSISALALDLLAQLLHLADRLFLVSAHLAFMALNLSRRSASSFWSSASGPCDRAVVLLS